MTTRMTLNNVYLLTDENDLQCVFPTYNEAVRHAHKIHSDLTFTESEGVENVSSKQWWSYQHNNAFCIAHIISYSFDTDIE